MAANAATLKIELVTDDKGTRVIKGFAESSKRHFTDVSRTVTHKLGGALKGLGRTAGGAFKGITKAVFSLKTAFIGLVVYGMNRVISGWEQLSSVQEKAEAGMIQAMKSMGRHTEVFEQEILDAASALQRLSTFGDEAILMGTKFLMTYKAIGDDVMPEAMKTMTDLAALMKGDFVSAANMLGKASMGMTGELRRVGITVDKETFELEGFAGVLRQIQDQVEGQAEALRATKAGGLEAFGNVVGDVKEKFGLFTSTIKANIAETILPYIDKANEKLQEWIATGAMEDKARQIGEAISTWVVAKIELAVEWYERLRAKGVDVAEKVKKAWEDVGPVLKNIYDMIKWTVKAFIALGEAVGKLAGWLSMLGHTTGEQKRAQAEADAIAAEIGVPIAAAPPSGPPTGPREDWTAAEVAQWGDKTTSEPVSGGVNLYINERLSRSDVTNIIVEQDRRAYRT